MKRRDTGALGERLAADFLKKKGFRIVETNFRCREGEIDIVARQKDYLVFVEVRTKTSDAFGLLEESITAAKQSRMRRAASRYRLNHAKLPDLWRIDFVAIEMDRFGKAVRIELIENAVGDI